MYPNDTTQDIPYGYCQCGCGQKTTIAKRNEYRRGHVKGEPLRFVHGHNPRLGSYVERFWSQVQILGTDDCWEWQGCRDSYGYGRIHIGSGSQSFLTHRIAYELTHGDIPEGMLVCHKCDNPPCCNPAHLEPVTQQENLKRGIQATRTHCLRGHEYGDYRRANGRRRCRACAQITKATWREKRKSK